MKWTVQLSNLEKDMTIKKFQIIVCAASLTLAGAANAQVFTGVLGIQEGSPQKSSFTSTSLALRLHEFNLERIRIVRYPGTHAERSYGL